MREDSFSARSLPLEALRLARSRLRVSQPAVNAVGKYKWTVEDHLEYLRRVRELKGLRHREGKHYLKELREEQGLTQKQLADRIGISQQFISRIESNWVNVGPKTIQRLAPALGVTLLELTLIEMLYRQTFARLYPSRFGELGEPVEELDVDRWTLREALDRWSGGLVPYDPKEDDEGGGYNEEYTEMAEAALERLRERYGEWGPYGQW
jgi:transcriptional regulator with XRE-family HTH domain